MSSSIFALTITRPLPPHWGQASSVIFTFFFLKIREGSSVVLCTTPVPRQARHKATLGLFSTFCIILFIFRILSYPTGWASTSRYCLLSQLWWTACSPPAGNSPRWCARLPWNARHRFPSLPCAIERCARLSTCGVKVLVMYLNVRNLWLIVSTTCISSVIVSMPCNVLK